jgi:hypothetical protein
MGDASKIKNDLRDTLLRERTISGMRSSENERPRAEVCYWKNILGNRNHNNGREIDSKTNEINLWLMKDIYKLNPIRLHVMTAWSQACRVRR